MDTGHTKSEEKAIQQAKVRRVMRSLQSVWTRIRQRGREEYRLLSQDERRQLLLTLFQQYQNHMVYKVFPHIMLAWFVLSAVLLAFNPVVGVLCLLAILVLTGSSLKLWHEADAAGKNLLSLSQDNPDVTLVPFLLDFARRRGGRTGSYRNRIEIVGLFLRQLLPQMSPESTAQWTLDQRESLSDILTAPFVDFNLTVTVLSVIGFAGARSALPRVQFLANLPDYRITPTVGKSRKENKKNAQWIRKAARECLPALTERFVGLEATETLLRSSEQSREDAARQLLRIADGRLSSEETELLRPQALKNEGPWGTTDAKHIGYDSVSGELRAAKPGHQRIGSET